MHNREIEILSIPYLKFEQKAWFLKSFEIDLNVKPHTVSLNKYPISQSVLLPIGTKIENGIYTQRDNGHEERYYFKDFSNGILEPMSALPEEAYKFLSIPSEIYDITQLYSIDYNGRKTSFFTFELFRQFIGFDTDICRLIMEGDMLDIYIDSQELKIINDERTLFLEFNNLIDVRLIQSDEFVNNLADLLFNPELRRYWKEIQSNTVDQTNNFTFKEVPYKQLKCSAQIKEYKNFDLVLHITTLDTLTEFPFDNIEVKHPKLKERLKSPAKGNNEKTGKFDNDVPKNYEFKDNETNAPNRNKRTNVNINKAGIKFKKKAKIKRIKKAPDENDKPKGNKKLFENFKLKNIELSFKEYDREGSASTAVLVDFNDDQSFDFTEVPPGLQQFCNAIAILSKKMKVGFNYEILQISNEKKSAFIYINNVSRKSVLITFPDNPEICLLEIDSSDDKYVSTLIFTNLEVENKADFVKELLSKTAIRNGSWDTEYLMHKCRYEKIKHPKSLTKYKEMSSEDVKNSLTKRIAFLFLNILCG